MLKDGINGLCMALSDSVPGVSGGTIAFIMGFYDRFIGSIFRCSSSETVFYRNDCNFRDVSSGYLWHFHIAWAILGVLLVFGLQMIKERKM